MCLLVCAVLVSDQPLVHMAATNAPDRHFLTLLRTAACAQLEKSNLRVSVKSYPTNFVKPIFAEPSKIFSCTTPMNGLLLFVVSHSMHMSVYRFFKNIVTQSSCRRIESSDVCSSPYYCIYVFFFRPAL